jgi:hypothetical protein
LRPPRAGQAFAAFRDVLGAATRPSHRGVTVLTCSALAGIRR